MGPIDAVKAASRKYRSLDTGWRIAGNAMFSDYVVGPTVAFGAVYCMDNLLKHETETFSNFVAKQLVEPWLPQFEWGAKLAGQTGVAETEAWQKEAVSREDRAKHLASSLVKFLVPTAASILVETLVQDKLDSRFGVQQTSQRDLWLARLVVNPVSYIGSYFFLTKGIPKQTEAVKNGFSNVLQTAGFSKKSADEIAHFGAWYEIPSLISNAFVIGMLTHSFNKHNQK